MHSHFKDICTECDKIIRQCQCQGPFENDPKTVHYFVCNDCQYQHGEPDYEQIMEDWKEAEYENRGKAEEWGGEDIPS
jgi:hypothetical protein